MDDHFLLSFFPYLCLWALYFSVELAIPDCLNLDLSFVWTKGQKLLSPRSQVDPEHNRYTHYISRVHLYE